MPPVPSFFSHPGNFTAALVHRSYCNEHPGLPSNERLEFLGDAVLSLIISHRLYTLLPTLPEGELTARRSYLVRTPSLAAKSQSLGLDKLLKLSRGEEDSGGRNNPSLLANTFEAVLGSLYLDSGLPTCQEYLSLVFPDSELTGPMPTKDPKSLLQEKSQELGWGTPNYRLVSATGPDHAKQFTVEVSLGSIGPTTGQGKSIQKAETEAATAALTNLL